MKCLFVLPHLKIGGVTTSFNSLYNQLKLTDISIDVFTITDECDCDIVFRDKLLPFDKLLCAYYSQYSQLSGINKLFSFVIKLIKRLSLILRINFEEYLIKKVVKELEKRGYDCIVAFAEGVPTQFVQYFSNKNKIAWIHCNYILAHPYRESDVYLYDKFKNIICVSKYTADCFMTRFPMFREKVKSIYNIIDYERISNLSSLPLDDSLYQSKKGDFNIISVGRIASVKRYREIPRIINSLLNEGVNIKWFVIGPIWDQDEYQLIQQNINQYSVSDSVFFLGGKENPYTYFRNADLLVCLSESEACPMIFNEAKIVGLPIVSSDFGSAYEFINENTDGLVAPIEKINQAILKLCKDKDLYYSIKNNNYDYSVESYQIVSSILNLMWYD